MQRRIEYRRTAGAFEIASEAKLELRSVQRRRWCFASERLDIEHGKDVAGDGPGLTDNLGKPIKRGERMDPLDTGGARHARIIDEIRDPHCELVGRAIAAVRHQEVFEIGEGQLPFDYEHSGIHAECAVAGEAD